jgi:hypothetical protein
MKFSLNFCVRAFFAQINMCTIVSSLFCRYWSILHRFFGNICYVLSKRKFHNSFQCFSKIQCFTYLLWPSCGIARLCGAEILRDSHI